MHCFHALLEYDHTKNSCWSDPVGVTDEKAIRELSLLRQSSELDWEAGGDSGIHYPPAIRFHFERMHVHIALLVNVEVATLIEMVERAQLLVNEAPTLSFDPACILARRSERRRPWLCNEALRRHTYRCSLEGPLHRGLCNWCI